MVAPTSLVDHVLRYAARGWHVFPVWWVRDDGRCACGRIQCSVGKHPIGTLAPQGFQNATTDDTQIRKWWNARPEANIGVATGAVSGFVVLDIDPDKGGDDSLHELIEQHGPLPETPVANTGGGGTHYLFEHPGYPVKDSSGELGAGVDVRGDGGYIVAPPSSHASGQHYAWDAAAHPDDLPLGPLPEWIGQPRKRSADGEGGFTFRAASGFELDWEIPEGRRDSTITKLAGVLRRYGLNEAEMLPTLAEVNQARCRPPLPERDVRRIAWSIGQKPADESLLDEVLETGIPPEQSAAKTTGVQTFPLDALPVVVREFSLAWAEALSSVPEIIALPCLFFASSAIGMTRTIRMTPQYTETALLWASIIGPPGSAKSAALRESGRPLSNYNANLIQEFEKANEDYKWRVSNRARGQTLPEPPKPKRRLAQNTTVEALAKLLWHDKHGVGVVNDELAGWINSFDQYKNKGGSDRQHWLSIWSGEEIIVDRIREGGSFYIREPFAAICGSIQPELLGKLTSELGNDGFLGRFVFAYVPRLPLTGLEDLAIEDATRRHWEDTIQTLTTYEAQILIPFTRLGYAVFKQGAQAWADEANAPETEARMLDFYSKGKRTAGRLALILHCIREASGEVDEDAVDEDTAKAAWSLMRYFASTMKYVVMQIDETETDRMVDAIVAYARSNGRSVTVREAQRDRVAGIKGADDMKKAFKTVADRGFGKVEEKTVQGGQRVTLWLEEPLSVDSVTEE